METSHSKQRFVRKEVPVVHHRPTLFFTDREKTEKTTTVGNAIEAAGVCLRETHGQTSICVDSVVHRDRREKITIVELNEISERIIDDTLFNR